ncbi:MAG: fibronectin type III domain-containing protein [Acidobacteria bacterium]|nr:fibronectin type III domain-containing protein [Acidobacteriota bacterium]MBV9071930.1 fibronectin type III domain-containing protein [Acidobacteriota bacterium]MBV9185372.1 fibronectin type III domain-containing protein [Acidobacteriota bacterium]
MFSGSLAAALSLAVLLAAPTFAAGHDVIVQTAPVLASNGVDFITGWTEEIAQNRSFAVRRVSVSGLPLDEQQTDLGPVDSPNATDDINVAGPRHGIACAPGTCLAVWQDSETIRGKWVTGAAAASSSFVIGQGLISDRPVVWNGHEFFLSWAAGQLYSATISTVGTVSAPTRLTNYFLDLSSPPEVGWDGKHYLLMLPTDASRCDCQDPKSLIRFNTLAADGTILGENFFFADFLDAHLASSGHDFLVTYDHYAYPAAGVQLAARRIVATDTDPQIGDPILLFQWFAPMSSSATWNGTDYVAAWRYGAGSSWWLSEARVTTPAFPSRRLTSSGIPDRQVAPAIASNAAGESIIVTSESPTLGEPARLRTYAEAEIDALPPPFPATPSAVNVSGSPSKATVTWQSDGRDVAGFLVERVYGDYGEIIAVVSAGARSIAISGTLNLRVRAFNASGESESATAVVNPPRRRAAGR